MLTRPKSPSVRPTTARSLAIRRGRSDVLQSLRRRGMSIDMSGVESLIAACALDEGSLVEEIRSAQPELVAQLRAEGATLIAEFAGTGNARGVARLLDLGVPVDARYGGDPYFGTAPESTALHVAAHRAWPKVIELLIARGADVNARDAKGNTPLMNAVWAATKSWWTGRRTPDGVRALLAAGASKDGISPPTGYAAIDELLV